MTQTDRRRAEWAETRAEIEALLWPDDGRTQLINVPGINNRLLRAYRLGLRRGGELATPRPLATVAAETWNEPTESKGEL